MGVVPVRSPPLEGAAFLRVVATPGKVGRGSDAKTALARKIACYLTSTVGNCPPNAVARAAALDRKTVHSHCTEIEDLRDDPAIDRMLDDLREVMIRRGSSDGVAKEFECRSAFVCTSINIPAMRGQDQSRFAFLNLDRFAEAKANPAIPWERMGEVGRQLLRRMIDGFPRWAETLLAFKKALIDVGGHDARGAEQFGALLAAAHIASSDEAPSVKDLERWATLLRAPDLSETAYKTDDWRECLNQLCDVTPDALRNKMNAAPTLGHRLNAFARTHEAVGDLRDMCRMMGLTLSFPKGQLPMWEHGRLFIPSNHPETRKTFAGTTWEGIAGATGVWHTTLKRAPADIAWEGTCGAGLDKKRPGVFVQLAAAFPDAGKADEEYEEAA